MPCARCQGTRIDVEALAALIAEREAAAEKRGRNRGRNHLHCDHCGGTSHVADDDGCFTQDTVADCITCGMPGMVEINESGNAYWKDDEDGKCNQANCSECHGEELAAARERGRIEGLELARLRQELKNEAQDCDIEQTMRLSADAELARIRSELGELLSAEGCSCECAHDADGHEDDCELCFACQVEAALVSPKKAADMSEEDVVDEIFMLAVGTRDLVAATEKRGRLAGLERALDRVKAKADVCLDDYAEGLQLAVEVIEKEVTRAK
jgi:hypothetical protein